MHKDWGPDTWAKFDGLIWDVAAGVVRVGDEKRERVVAELRSLLRCDRQPLGLVREVVGELTALLTVLPEGKAFLQAGFTEVAAAVEWARHGELGREDPSVAASIMEPTTALRFELQWWLGRLSGETSPSRLLSEVAGKSGRVRPRYQGYTDASGKALSAVWGDLWAMLKVPERWRFVKWAAQAGIEPEALVEARSGESVQAARFRTSSTLLEVAALLLALRAWCRAWAGGEVTLFCDNKAAGRVWSKRHARHPKIAGLIRAMMHLCIQYDISLSVVFIKGALNTRADAVSRLQMGRFRALVPTAALFPTPVDVHPLEDWLAQCSP